MMKRRKRKKRRRMTSCIHELSVLIIHTERQHYRYHSLYDINIDKDNVLEITA